MKQTYHPNIWISILALCLTAFLGYRAIETKDCVEINLENKLIRAGDCQAH